MPARKKKLPDESFPLRLTVEQRESLVHATRIVRRIRTRIKEASPDQEFVEFTEKELRVMEKETDVSLAFPPPADAKRLNDVLDRIQDLLADIEGKELVENRRAVAKSGAIYQLKVTLEDSDPPIWRRIQVPDCTLGR